MQWGERGAELQNAQARREGYGDGRELVPQPPTAAKRSSQIYLCPSHSLSRLCALVPEFQIADTCQCTLVCTGIEHKQQRIGAKGGDNLFARHGAIMGSTRRRINRTGGQGHPSSTRSVRSPSKDTNIKKKAKNDGSAGAIFATVRPTNIKLFCAFTGFLLYVRSIWVCYFPYDDGGGVRNNPDVLNQSNANGLGTGIMSTWTDVFRNDFWGTSINSPLTHKSYRPIVIMSFRFDAIMTKWIEQYVLGEAWVEQMRTDGDIEHKGAWMFHATNVLLYALVCYLVVDILLIPVANGAPEAAISMRRQPTHVLSRNQSLGILLAGLWFASHPVHAECVAQIVGRAEILAALFCLLGTKCYNISKMRGSIWRSMGGNIGLVVSLFLGCLCKETACVLPIVLVGTEIAVAAFAPSKGGVKDQSWDKSTFPILSFASALSVTLGYLVFRSWLFDGRQDLSPENILIYDNFVLHLSGLPKLMTALFIQAKYMELLFWPNEVSSDYSLGVIDPVFSWSDPSMILFYGVLMGLLLVIGAALRTLVSIGNTALVQAIGWTFAPLVPASHIVTIGTPMAERLLFTPSIGVAILICHSFSFADTAIERDSSGRRKIPTRIVMLTAILATSIARFSFMTYQRVPEWTDSKALFEADIQKFPRSVKLNMALAQGWWGETAEESAKSYAHAKAAQEVVDSYGDAFKRTPYVIGLPMMAFQQTRNTIWPDANLSDALSLANKVEQLDAQRKISTDDMALVLSARGQALLKMGLPKQEKQLLIEAETAFRKAERNDGTERAPYITYCSHGLSLILLGRKEEAHGKYQICFQRKPPSEVPYADVSNYANLMGELAGFASKDASAASKWGKEAKEAFDVVLSHPGLNQKPGHRKRWHAMLSWVESNRYEI